MKWPWKRASGGEIAPPSETDSIPIMSECQGADFSLVARALGQGLIDHADRDGLTGVRRAVFMDRGRHAPGERCPSAPPPELHHEYWCQYPDDECACRATRETP